MHFYYVKYYAHCILKILLVKLMSFAYYSLLLTNHSEDLIVGVIHIYSIGFIILYNIYNCPVVRSVIIFRSVKRSLFINNVDFQFGLKSIR